jgi:transcriptional regulator with XRE-family HTH domain
MKSSYHDLDYAYGSKMQKLRNSIGLTQAGLADKLGVSLRTVAGWEAGRSYPRVAHLKELIALAVQQRAFDVGHEAEEIRLLWKVAHQRTWLEERWLSALLDQQSCPQEHVSYSQLHVEPKPGEATMTTVQVTEQEPADNKPAELRTLSDQSSPVRPSHLTGLDAVTCQPQGQNHEQLLEAGTTSAPTPLPDGSLPQTLSETNADQPLMRSPTVEAEQPQEINHPEIPDQTMTEKSLSWRSGIGTEHDPHSPHSETEKTRRRRKWPPLILIALVVLIIIGSAGALFFQARRGATGQVNKTATARAYPAYLSGHSTLAFFDPLSQEGKWHPKSTDTGGSCQFTGGAYRVSILSINYFSWCRADGIFGNFAFEVQLTITKGDCGGITFRKGDDEGYYLFDICQDSTYQVVKFLRSKGSDRKTFQSSRSSAIHTGLAQQNKIAVVASGSTMTFYVNEQQIDVEQDSSYTGGHIALIANPRHGNPTDVAYSNARLWTL